MALPVVIAKNQTGSPIFLNRLGLSVPATPATITLTDFASFYEISWEADLQTPVGNGSIVINDGNTDLSALAAIGYLDATGNLNGPITGLTTNALLKLNGTTGRYAASTGITVDGSNNLGGAASLGVRSSGTGAFDVSMINTENLTAARNLTVTLNNADRTINLGGNLTLSNAFSTSGVFPITLTATGSTNVTLPTSGTLLSTATTTLQLAYNNGSTIVTASSTPVTFTLTSGGFTTTGVGTVSIGADAAAATYQFGTGAAVKTVTVGSTNSTSSLVLDSGTGNIDIGAGAQARTINIGTGAAVVETINIGGTGANPIRIGNTQTGGSVNIGDAMTGGTITIGGTTNAMTGTITLGGGIGAQAINLATGGTGAKTTTLGSTASTSSTKIDSGTGNIDIGTTAQARSINVGTAGAVQAVTVGSTNSTSSLVSQTGTGAMTFTAGGVFDVNATGLLTLDSSGGAINIGNDAVAQAINIGTGAAARTITVGNTTGASAVNLTAGTGNVNTTSALAWNGVITPTSLGSSQNDYNPTSLSTASTIRQDASAAVNITGLAGGVNGRIIIFYNISSTFAITLVNESASSTAANRFTLPLNVRLAPSDSIILQYDGTTSRWRAPATSKGTVSGIQKSRFYQFAANAATAKGDHNTVAVGANASINLELMIPDDFTTLVSIQAIMIPGATNATANIDLNSDYGAVGEVYNVNSESNTTNTYALTTQVITGIDLSSVAAGIAAGDFFGVLISHTSIGASANYLGALLRYT